jgi:acetyl esterase/lipase
LSRLHDCRRLVRAYGQAAYVLAATLELPGTNASGRAAPTVDESPLGAIPMTIVRPHGPPPWPTLLFVNGATPDGRAHPVVRRLALALGRSGFAVYIPELRGISCGELTPTTLASAIECARLIADSPETLDGRLALSGVSIGGTLALLVAADETLGTRISLVAGIAPFTDLRKVVRLATTGVYRDGSTDIPYPTPPSLAAGLARSLAAMVPPNSDSIRELLANRDAAQFDRLYDALPREIHVAVEALSPRSVASQIHARVEIATAPRDTYFPVAESLALTRTTQARVTVTSALSHARPHLDPRNLAGLTQLGGFFVRSLRAAA